MKSLKRQLYEECLTYTDKRIIALTDSIHVIQQSANQETKSTAGDKYETGRAMAQLEIDNHRSQLAEAVKMKQELLRVPVEDTVQSIKPGTLVFTPRGNFYIAINAGQQKVNDQIFYTVSAGAPIAQKLIGLKAGDVFSLNNQEFTILEIQ